MDAPAVSIRAWARQLVAAEAANQSPSDTQSEQAGRVSEKLRISLTRFLGADGFAALLRRALALAKADNPSLRNVKVTVDGHLVDTTEFPAVAASDIDGGAAITEHLLGLLVTFIGESLTLRLIREVWPDASLDE